jgi:UDP-N-acetylmuramate: L-alanyl-gamma-D-glutamyl-meso-diaminopimelate ligase
LKLHFIGIGGTGMGAFARLMQNAGHDVRGSDDKLYPPMSTQLERAKISVFTGYRGENLDWGPDRIVVGNVCSKDHPEVLEAQRRGIALESFPSLLESTILAEKRSLVIAGTHGKTTTSSLLAWILRYAGQDPSWLVGGVPMNTNRGSYYGAGPAIVLEGDEYDTAFFDKKSKFLHYRPFRAAITSVEFDHADIFAGIAEVRQAFREFASIIAPDGQLFVNQSDAEAMGVAAESRAQILTYRILGDGEDDVTRADYCARVVSRPTARRTVIEWYEKGVLLGHVATILNGRYNAGNVLVAMAMARAEGCSSEVIARAIAAFRGVKRRQELAGVAQGVRVIADFAHHPSAVQVTTKAVRRRYPEKSLFVCFDPRSASSRRSVFFDAYAGSFSMANEVLIGPLHAPEKIPPAQRLDVQALAAEIRKRGVSARAFASATEIAQTIVENAVPGDTVLVLSSGSFDGLVEQILRGFGDAVVRGEPEDRPGADALLAAYNLAPILASDDTEALVIRGQENAIVGCVHLELNDDIALFFGLAVHQDRRGEGLGWTLADYALRRARTLGARTVYLLTTDSADFFASKWGFRPVGQPIESLDPRLLSMTNFASARLAGSMCMKCELEP